MSHPDRGLRSLGNFDSTQDSQKELFMPSRTHSCSILHLEPIGFVNLKGYLVEMFKVYEKIANGQINYHLF